jgi:hypothetical protein
MSTGRLGPQKSSKIGPHEILGSGPARGLHIFWGAARHSRLFKKIYIFSFSTYVQTLWSQKKTQI